MLTVGETWERLRPRIQDAAGVLHDDESVSEVQLVARFHGVAHRITLERAEGKGPGAARLEVVAGRVRLYRGTLAGVHEKADGRGRRAA